MLDTRPGRTDDRQDDAYPRAYQPWRPVDEMVLKALVHSRMGIDEIARRLRRTPAEIETHLTRLELV